jgi:hypothetical protein
MPLWRCPHCATPQPESSRCWLCGRSTTTCAACRHYRRGVAGGLGLCGRQPGRMALRGTEVRPCWEAMPTPDERPLLPEPASRSLRGDDGLVHRTFVPVDELRARGDEAAASAAPPPASGAGSPARWSLWGDLDA